MDPALYKDIHVKRGYTYHYYHTPPRHADKPTLLFIHGFPSTSYDWRRQAAHFANAGYGVLIPDMLGYGGSSKPILPAEYRNALVAKDVVEIVDAERLTNVVAVGHDWGSVILSRVADLFPDRFLGFAWLAVSYSAPQMEPFDLQAFMKRMHATIGRDMFGYWELFIQDDGYKLAEKNVSPCLHIRQFDSFFSIIYPTTPDIYYEWLSPSGKTIQWLTENRTSPRPEWMSEEEHTTAKEHLRRGGMRAPLCYYRVRVGDYNVADSKEILKAGRKFDRPALFFAGTRDGVCDATLNKGAMKKFAPHVKIVDMDTGHWIMLEATDRLNAELEGWVRGLHVGPVIAGRL
ncbi:alpha/beta-hydrolase [Fomes fomentarius]|nr:alpha/beta-hydrolase [Fomes fomentarius]